MTVNHRLRGSTATPPTVAPAVPLGVTRRAWLTQQVTALGLVTAQPWALLRGPFARRTAARSSTVSPEVAARVAAQAARLDPEHWQALAQQAVETARKAGAQYADARLMRTVNHFYNFTKIGHYFGGEAEMLGVGVRALVDGYWGFAACPTCDEAAVVRLAGDAVALARASTIGPRWAVEMGTYPVATGSWATPIRIDPFTVTIEEKSDYIAYWAEWATRFGCGVDDIHSYLHFVRQERVVATSDGACFTQTVYESDGVIVGGDDNFRAFTVQGLGVAAKGWELVLDARIPEQIEEQLAKKGSRGNPKLSQRVELGRYPIVCDGATMASLLERTLGIATQLDRALGYEANAGGTSYLNDPLAMVGHLQVASPLVTVTANRSVPGQLATVKWDEEGVEPQPFTLVEKGILTDFQTTREQASWLAPYYQAQGRPIRSHGCAAAESALHVTMQHMPNLALAPNPASVSIDDLIANVKDGYLLGTGEVLSDFQARNGLIVGGLARIKNGRKVADVDGGAVQFNTQDLWTHIVALGGSNTQTQFNISQYPTGLFPNSYGKAEKGQPPQVVTSHTISAVAATITNQPIIDPNRKA